MVILAPTKKYIWRLEGKLPEMRHSTENSSWAPEEKSPMGHERLTLEQSFRLTGVSSLLAGSGHQGHSSPFFASLITKGSISRGLELLAFQTTLGKRVDASICVLHTDSTFPNPSLCPACSFPSWLESSQRPGFCDLRTLSPSMPGKHMGR